MSNPVFSETPPGCTHPPTLKYGVHTMTSNLTDTVTIRLRKADIAYLKDLQKDYPGDTVGSMIRRMVERRIDEMRASTPQE